MSWRITEPRREEDTSSRATSFKVAAGHPDAVLFAAARLSRWTTTSEAKIRPRSTTSEAVSLIGCHAHARRNSVGNITHARSLAPRQGPHEPEHTMDPVIEFRRNAEECRRMARTTANLEDKTLWNQLAERWLACATQFESRRDAAAQGSRSRAARRASNRSAHAA
jgi:hypothetical protein